MADEINKEQVRKDLLAWAKKLNQADTLLREVYNDMNKVYVEAQE